MNMNFSASLLQWSFAVAVLLGSSALTHAQSNPGPMSIDDFSASQGWVFQTDLTKADSLEDLDGCLSVADDAANFVAADFDPATFNPQDYAIPLGDDASKPSNFRVGNQGVIQFHSTHRLELLYKRYLSGFKAEKK